MAPRKRGRQGVKSKTKNQPSAAASTTGWDDLHKVTNPKPSGRPSSPSYWRLLASFCVLSSLLLYWNTVSNDFVYDDLVAVVKNPDVRGERPLSFLFRSDFWGAQLTERSSNKSYRPVTTWTFRATAAWHGMEPGPFHVTNVILNAIACALAVRCVAIMSDEQEGPSSPSSARGGGMGSALTSFPVVTSVLFTFHPVHTEDVACVVGRADLLGAIFGFLAFHCHSRCVAVGWGCDTANSNDPLTSALYFGACLTLSWLSALSKETGLTILAICGAHEVARFWLPAMTWGGKEKSAKGENSVAATSTHARSKPLRASIVRFVVLAGTGVAFLLFRRAINGPQTVIIPSVCDNPLLTAESTLSYCLTALHIMTLYVWRLVNPFVLLCDYGYNVVPLVEGLADPRNLATLSLVLGVVVLAAIGLRNAASKSRSDGRLFMALAWIFVPLLPATHVIVLGTVLAERLLFVPSLGYCMLLALFLERCVLGGGGSTTNSRGKRDAKSALSPTSSLAALAVILTLFSQRIISRNQDWKNNRALWTADYATNPENVKIAQAYGSELELEGRLDEAWRVTRDLQGLGSYQRTEVCFVKARTTALSGAAGRNFTLAFEIVDDCIKEAEKLKKPTTNQHQLYGTKAYILSAQGKFQDAVPWFQKAAELASETDPTNFQPICNEGEILSSVGRWVESISPLEKCVELSEKRREVVQKRVVYMSNLAGAYIQIKQISRAEALLKESQKMLKTKKAADMLESIHKKKQATSSTSSS